MGMKIITAAYRANVRAACDALGRSIPKDYTTSTASNGDFVVYDSGMRIVGRLLPADTKPFMREGRA